MKQHEFELRVMKLWTTTRVPMTRANLIAYTHAERANMEPWLDELVKAGLLEVDSDDEGVRVAFNEPVDPPLLKHGEVKVACHLHDPRFSSGL